MDICGIFYGITSFLGKYEIFNGVVEVKSKRRGEMKINPGENIEEMRLNRRAANK